MASPKRIETLVADIYDLLRPDYDHSFDESNVLEFGTSLARHISSRLRSVHSQVRPSLRLSQIGKVCKRELWYSINQPEKAEPLPPAVRFKFLFGDILEELLLFLGKEAGHTVEGQQDELEINGVKGHRDAIIDGRLVDVKSASSRSFEKFARNGLRDEDPFGYLDQLGAYLAASQEDPLLKEKDVASFLVIDKTLGHITLDTYPKSDVNYSQRVDELKEMISSSEPPARLEDVPEGKSGNRKLCTTCSYCSYKKHCWDNLRTFLYSSGPMYLTKVEREPKVAEVTLDF